MDNQVLKLHDATIAQIVRLIQLGILTGTDVSDQLRTLECVVDESRIAPNPEYMQTFEKTLQTLEEAFNSQEQPED